MNLSTVAVKNTAKTALKGNYFSSIAACTIYIFAFIVCEVCYELSSSVIGPVFSFVVLLLLLMLFIIPLTLGLIYFTVRLIFGTNAEPILIFKYFCSRKDFKRALAFAFYISGNAVFYGFIFLLPSFFVDIIADGRIFKIFGAQIPLWASGLTGVSASLKVLALIFLLAVMMKFYLAPFLFAANEDMEVLQTLHTSKIISSVTKKDFIWLILSFIWHILACLFVIPNIFIFPYFATSYCVHCRFCLSYYNDSVDKINKKIPSFEVTL